jgi:hypothetical protein
VRTTKELQWYADGRCTVLRPVTAPRLHAGCIGRLQCTTQRRGYRHRGARQLTGVEADGRFRDCACALLTRPQLNFGVRPRTTPSYSTIRNDAEVSDMSRVQHFDGRGRDPRPRKPSNADVASRSRGREVVDWNQNAWEGTPASGQLSLSQVRIPQDVRAAGLTIVQPDG